jgi:hypothetical protein
MDHVKAMRTVREWEYTQRFGHLGTAQTSRANSARVVEYFSDSYRDGKEAIQKAELFLTIYDYVARNGAFFSKKGWLEVSDSGAFSVDPVLLRAVHFAFTLPERTEGIDPKRVLTLARAFKELATPE